MAGSDVAMNAWWRRPFALIFRATSVATFTAQWQLIHTPSVGRQSIASSNVGTFTSGCLG